MEAQEDTAEQLLEEARAMVFIYELVFDHYTHAWQINEGTFDSDHLRHLIESLLDNKAQIYQDWDIISHHLEEDLTTQLFLRDTAEVCSLIRNERLA